MGRRGSVTAKERAEALAGIAQLQGILRSRVARGRETDDACDARHNNEASPLESAEKQVGQDWMQAKTRFSSQTPDLSATVESFVIGCLGCTGANDQERVPHECAQAAVVLPDLAATVKASK